MVHTRMLAILRAKLRALNIEHSALRRSGSGEARSRRMRELRLERQALMLLIAEERGEQRATCKVRVPAHAPSSPLRSA